MMLVIARLALSAMAAPLTGADIAILTHALPESLNWGRVRVERSTTSVQALEITVSSTWAEGPRRHVRTITVSKPKEPTRNIHVYTRLEGGVKPSSREKSALACATYITALTHILKLGTPKPSWEAWITGAAPSTVGVMPLPERYGMFYMVHMKSAFEVESVDNGR
jgi:hypothetical protein